jgi:hypothetical protein
MAELTMTERGLIVNDFIRFLKEDHHIVYKLIQLKMRIRNCSPIYTQSINRRVSSFVKIQGERYVQKCKTNDEWISKFPFMANKTSLDFITREEIVSRLIVYIINVLTKEGKLSLIEDTFVNNTLNNINSNEKEEEED